MAAGAQTQLLIDIVRLRIAEPYAGTVQDVDIAKFITLAQQDLIFRLPSAALWFCTETEETTIVADQSSYLLETVDISAPSFFYEVNVVWKDISAKRWEPEHIRKLRGTSDLQPSDDQPYYVIHDDSIEFLFTAVQAGADVFSIEYVKVPADIDIGVGAVDMTFPKQYNPIIANFVSAKCFEVRGNDAAHDKAFATYLEAVAKANESYERGDQVDQFQADVRRV